MPTNEQASGLHDDEYGCDDDKVSDADTTLLSACPSASTYRRTTPRADSNAREINIIRQTVNEILACLPFAALFLWRLPVSPSPRISLYSSDFRLWARRGSTTSPSPRVQPFRGHTAIRLVLLPLFVVHVSFLPFLCSSSPSFPPRGAGMNPISQSSGAVGQWGGQQSCWAR